MIGTDPKKSTISDLWTDSDQGLFDPALLPPSSQRDCISLLFWSVWRNGASVAW